MIVSVCGLSSSHVTVWAVFGAWRCTGLSVQRGAPADTETLRHTGSNPFWTSPCTNMGPYVWEGTNAVLCFLKGGRERDENILPLCLPAIRSVMKSSCEHTWGITVGRKKKIKKKELPLSLGEDRKVNYIKQTCHSDSTQIVDYCFD